MNFSVYPWQESQWQQLQAAGAGQRMPHALLLTGPEGMGQRQFADRLAAGLLCPGGLTDPCGQCKSCVLLRAESHPDLFRVEPEASGRQIRVESIRNLIGFIQLKSQYGRYKIAIIDPADAMNRTSANTLLKTLEEPPPDSLLILISHQPARLPITVRSRCQKIGFPASRQLSTVEWLGADMDGDMVRAGELLMLATGRPLYAKWLLETDTIATQRQILADLKLLSADTDVVKIARDWHAYGSREVFQWLMGFISTMIRYHAAGQNDPVDKSGPALQQDLQQLANGLDLQQLVGGYDLALRNYRDVTGMYNLNPLGLLEEFLVYWQSLKRSNERR